MNCAALILTNADLVSYAKSIFWFVILRANVSATVVSAFKTVADKLAFVCVTVNKDVISTQAIWSTGSG